jgi:hypothetical protein
MCLLQGAFPSIRMQHYAFGRTCKLLMLELLMPRPSIGVRGSFETPACWRESSRLAALMTQSALI